MDKKCIIFRKRIGIIVALLLGVLATLVSLCGVNSKSAFADQREKNLEITQFFPLYYCGENYLSEDRLKKELIDSIYITIDKNYFNTQLDNTIITCDRAMVVPGTYFCNVTVIDDNGNQYTQERVPLSILKRDVKVTVYLNGVTDLTINENEKIDVTYDYDGALEGDYYVENISGREIKTLKKEVLEHVAYLDDLPSAEVTNYTVAASHAVSDYYNFIYEKSNLTIIAEKVSELHLNGKDGASVYLIGEFNSLSEVFFTNIGVSSVSQDYLSIVSRIKEKYNGTDLLKNYTEKACYSIGVSTNGNIEKNISAKVLMKLDGSLEKNKSYKIIAVYNNGDTEVLDAKISDGYLNFNVMDMGKFVVYAPIEGINLSSYIFAIAIGIIVILLVVFFVAIFRKKY